MNRRAGTQSVLLVFPVAALALLASCSHNSSAAAQTLPPPITFVRPAAPTLVRQPRPPPRPPPRSTTTTEAPTDDDRGADDDRTEAPTTTTEAPTTTTTAAAATSRSSASAEQPIEAVGGHSGDATAVVQARLLQLGFWNNGSRWQYGFTTTQAVMAFQKYIGLPPTVVSTQATADYMTELRREGSRLRRHRHARRGRQGQAVVVHRSRRQDDLDVQHLHRQRHPVRGAEQERSDEDRNRRCRHPRGSVQDHS